MIRVPKKGTRLRKWFIVALLGMVAVAVPGCQTISFYSQAIRGQYQILAHEQKVDKLLQDPKTSDSLRKRLEVLSSLRQFAQDDLKLPVDGHYRKYVDLHRRYVVWNVEAAQEFSLEPKGWWYPLVGKLEYRGFFSKEGAHRYAAGLERKHLDVYVAGVAAYSTLGWFKDPALNTFIFDHDADLAEIIFHELGHQRVFARGDMDFNEAFATTVGQEGARRWIRKNSTAEALTLYEAQSRRTDDFVHLVQRTRGKLEKLYGDERTEDGRLKATRKPRSLSPEQLRAGKQQILADLQSEYTALKQSWGGVKEYEGWFARTVNNAQLNSVAAYYDLVPAFERLLELNGGNLEKFYQAAERLSKLPKKQRQQQLRLDNSKAIGTVTNTPSPLAPQPAAFDKKGSQQGAQSLARRERKKIYASYKSRPSAKPARSLSPEIRA